MEVYAPLGLAGILFRFGIVVLLVLANGFFVAAEFALVGARQTRIAALAGAGNRRARLAGEAIRHLDHYISGTQLGITLASLGLGWVGEQTVAAVLIQVFDGLPPPWNVVAGHTLATIIAFTLITFLHIVLGELAPKSIALLFPETTSLWTAGGLIAFSRLFGPFIAVLNGSANLLLRAVGLRAPTELERVHRPEEIEMLLTQSFEHGLLREQPVEMIRGVFDLSETTAAEVMTPRTEIVAVPVSATVDEAAEVILESGHARIPVFEDSIDRIVGVVLARDVWKAQRERQRELAPLVHTVPFVPESRNIEGLLREMQIARVHMAVVIDEFGGTAGIVTLEDLVEEIVGEIQDEHEAEVPGIEAAGNRILLRGDVPVTELNERFGLGLPEEDYTTVAGYVLSRLGRLPRVGEEIALPAARLQVVAMAGRRIERLVLTVGTRRPHAHRNRDRRP